MPFVADLEDLRLGLIRCRDRWIRSGSVRDTGPLNQLLAILSLYKPTDAWYLQPTATDRGNALELWRDLRKIATYRELSGTARRLGFLRDEAVASNADRSRRLALAVASNRRVGGVVNVTRAVVSACFGVPARAAFGALAGLFQLVTAEPYVPPVYSLREIERTFDQIHYPELADNPYDF